MRLRLILTCATGVTALVAGLWMLQVGRSGAGPSLLPYDDASAVAAGQVLYEENCAACHGIALEGQPDWRSTDADGFMPAPPHDENGHTWHHADTLLYMITKFGTAQAVGGDYKSNMAGFTDILSDEEILQTLAYIKSTWPPEMIEMHNTANKNAILGN
jgi:mono/diheme cytochrome c family protein